MKGYLDDRQHIKIQEHKTQIFEGRLKGLGGLEGDCCDLKSWPVQMALEGFRWSEVRGQMSDEMSQIGRSSQMVQISDESDGLAVKVKHEPEKPKEPDKSEELKERRHSVDSCKIGS